MMYHSDDALDRALFALPLEEPPAELRASILASTVYRPAPPFAVWEVALLGALAAVAVWLIVLVAMGGGTLFLTTLSDIGSAVERALSNVTALAWLAAGAATAFWLSLFNGPHSLALAARRIGRRTSR
jgi:hypothetical protein